MTDRIPEMSPLCRSITRDGHRIDVQIYRGDTGWILEVVDRFLNSTVWDDEFETDQQALDEVHRTIEEEGIESIVGSGGDDPAE
ncbi:MAG: hypothetical protein OEV30_12385 [Ignavibacteria bacterium]|nr:hypothetical protein [Ignavibacteria bacterium]